MVDYTATNNSHRQNVNSFLPFMKKQNHKVSDIISIKFYRMGGFWCAKKMFACLLLRSAKIKLRKFIKRTPKAKELLLLLKSYFRRTRVNSDWKKSIINDKMLNHGSIIEKDWKLLSECFWKLSENSCHFYWSNLLLLISCLIRKWENFKCDS